MIGPRIKVFVLLALVAVVAYEWPVQPTHPKLVLPVQRDLFRGGIPGIVELEPLSLDVAFFDLLHEARIEVRFSGNGRESLRMTAHNRSEHSVVLKVSAGQVFKSRANSVVLLHSYEQKVNPNQTVEQDLQTAALSSGNRVGQAGYTPASPSVARLNPLLSYLKYHQEMTPGAIQTAVLTLTENLPVSAFARFSRPDADLPSLIDTTPFRVDTIDLMEALMALRDIGISDSELAITVDPQLKSEAMIDPLAHALAMQYYKIPFDHEWSYWKNELLQGDPAIRHYALYGIARFFPEIAVQMLPKWARGMNLTPTYRHSAIRALAETGRPEALSVLHQFEFEFGGRGTELGEVAYQAAQYLDARLTQEPRKTAISFHTTKEVLLRSPTVAIGVSAGKESQN